jgi:ABC-type phosphate/phosphonate transport system substrate-binding protein
MIASLMMYARPELASAHSRLWACISESLRARDIPSPPELSQIAPAFDVWEDPDLILSQTCGMPYRNRLLDKVQLVGSPDYSLTDCPAGYYRSAVVVRADDPGEKLDDYADARLAYSASQSQSGFAALYNHVQPMGFWFAHRKVSGGHLASAQMVANGNADIASLDAQTWRLIQRYEPFADSLRVLEYTEPTPGLPLITGQQNDAKAVFAAVSEALKALNPEDKTALDLQGLVHISSEKYVAIPNPPEAASA